MEKLRRKSNDTEKTIIIYKYSINKIIYKLWCDRDNKIWKYRREWDWLMKFIKIGGVLKNEINKEL